MSLDWWRLHWSGIHIANSFYHEVNVALGGLLKISKKNVYTVSASVLLFVFFCLILYGAPALQCLWHDSVTLISTLLIMIIIIIIIINYRTLVINSAFIISHCHHQNALDVIACYWTDHLNRWSVPIGCCWITPRLKFSGAHHHVDNIRSHPVRSALAPSLFDPRLQGIHRRWHDHEDPHHSRRQSVLHRSTTDPERAAISLTSCLADLGSCTGCHQGGLLQLGSRWYLWYAARPVAVRLECRRPFGFLSEAVRMHNPIASWAPLVASSHSGCAFWPTAVFMEQRRRTLLRAFSGHLTSTLYVVCALLTQPLLLTYLLTYLLATVVCWWIRSNYFGSRHY